MHCPEALERLQQYLDGEPLAGVAALNEHIVACAECRERYAAVRRLRAGLAQLPAPVAASDLTQRIVRGTLRDRAARGRRRLVAVGTIAAGILLLLAAGLALPGLGGRGNVWVTLFGTSPPVDPPPSVPEAPDVAPPPPSLRESMADAGSAVASLTRRTADETVGQSRILLPEKVPMPAQPEPEAIGSDLEPAAQSLREARDGANAGLEPVTNSARRAVSLFLRGLPVPEPGTEE